MENTPLTKQKQRENYLAFMSIKDEFEALVFLTERIPNPAGNLPYTPSDYRWMTMPLVIQLRKTHTGFQNPFKRVAGDFWELDAFACALFSDPVDGMQPLTKWIDSRYAVEQGTYLRPPAEYTYITPEEIEASRLASEQPQPESPFLQEMKAWSWKKVGTTKEGRNTRTHCILVDKETGLEPPLLPGVKPYIA
jgi:hypothetical protein